jgi:hypothetical protein
VQCAHRIGDPDRDSHLIGAGNLVMFHVLVEGRAFLVFECDEVRGRAGEAQEFGKEGIS